MNKKISPPTAATRHTPRITELCQSPRRSMRFPYHLPSAQDAKDFFMSEISALRCYVSSQDLRGEHHLKSHETSTRSTKRGAISVGHRFSAVIMIDRSAYQNGIIRPSVCQ
jgi:hypothetical protein